MQSEKYHLLPPDHINKIGEKGKGYSAQKENLESASLPVGEEERGRLKRNFYWYGLKRTLKYLEEGPECGEKIKK